MYMYMYMYMYKYMCIYICSGANATDVGPRRLCRATLPTPSLCELVF